MAQVGTVKELFGVAQAVGIDGSTRVLVVGDAINEGEVVVTVGANSTVKISFESGKELALGGDEKSLIDQTVVSSEAVANEDVTAIQQALLAGEALPDEATAAGQDGPDGAGGIVEAYVAQRADGRGDVTTHDINTNGLINSDANGNQNDQINQAPEPVDDIVEAFENVTFSGNLLDNDSDDGLPNPDGDLDIVSVNGVVDSNGDGFITITTEFGTLNVDVETGDYEYLSNYDALAYGENEVETFEYVVTDGDKTATATLEITLNGTNDQPIAYTDSTDSWLLSVSEGDDDSDFIDSATTNSVSLSEINSFIDGSVNAQDVLASSETPTNGSALKVFVSVNAGEEVSFNWTFFDTEEEGQTTYSDFSFVVIDGEVINLLATSFEAGAENSGTFNYTFTDGGTHEIVFGVMNEDDSIVSPSLQVTHISGGRVIDFETLGVVENSNGINEVYETSDVDEVDTNEDGIIANDEDVTTLTGNLYADDLDLSDTHIFRLLDMEGEIVDSSPYDGYTQTLSNIQVGGVNYDQASYDSGNDETTSQSEVTVLVESNDINPTQIDIQSIVLSSNQQDDSQASFEIKGDFSALGVGESATITFMFVADDMHGFGEGELPNEPSISEPLTVTLSVKGTNDQPVVEDVSVIYNETSSVDNIVGESDQYFGQLSVSDNDINDSHTFEIEEGLPTVIITSTNPELMEILSDFGLEDIVNDLSDGLELPSDVVAYMIDNDYLSINLDSNTGEYSVESPIFNMLGTYDTMQVSFDYRADDGNGFESDELHEDSLSQLATATLTVEGTNDRPVASDEISQRWEKFALMPGVEDNTYEGYLPDSFGFDRIDVDDDILDTLSFKYYGIDGDDVGDATDVITTGNSVVDPTQTVVIVNEDGTYSVTNPTFQALGVGESATISFQYVIDDGRGFDGLDGINENSISEPATITLTIKGTNDKPVVFEDSKTINEALDDQTIYDGRLPEVQDDDVNDLHVYSTRDVEVDNPLATNVEVHLTNVSTGEYTMSGDFDALAVGESTDVTFWYRATDDSNSLFNLPILDELSKSDWKKVTLTVEGTNDQPVVFDVNANSNGENQFTYTNEENAPIPADGGSSGVTESTIEISDNGTIEDLNVQINLTHTWDSDLDITLIAPDGTVVELTSDNGSFGDNYTNTLFDDEALTDITSGYAPFSGTFRPEGDLSDFDGMDMSGIWTLRIVDDMGGDTGTLDSWSLQFTVDGETIVYEEFDGLNTFEDTLPAVMDDDVSDTHEYYGVVGDDMEIDYEVTSPVPVTISNIVVNTDGTYQIIGDFNSLAFGESATITFDYYVVDSALGGLYNGTDGINESSTSESKTVTLTITGTNDQPVIESVSTTTPVMETDLVGLPIGNPDKPENSYLIGQLNAEISDDDINDTHEFVSFEVQNVYETIDNFDVINHSTKVSLNSQGEFSLFNPDFNKLGVGEEVTVRFEVQVTDNRNDPNGELSVSEPEMVEVVIKGTNDQPTVTDMNFVLSPMIQPLGIGINNHIASGALEAFGDNDTVFNGYLQGHDEDTNDSLSYGLVSMEPDFLESGYDTVSYFKDGVNMGFISVKVMLDSTSEVDLDDIDVKGIQLDGSNFKLVGDFNTLPEGEVLTIQFKYNATDDSGSGLGNTYDETEVSETGMVTVTVTGTNDIPTITYELGSDVLGLLQEDNPLGQVVYGDLDITDLDAGESQFQSYTDNSSVYGTFSVNTNGSWSYILDNNAAQVLAQNQEITETYTVFSEDGTRSEDVTIKIYGQNDNPVAYDDYSVAAVEHYEANFNPVNLKNHITQSAAMKTIVHSDGDDSFSFDWSFDQVNGWVFNDVAYVIVDNNIYKIAQGSDMSGTFDTGNLSEGEHVISVVVSNRWNVYHDSKLSITNTSTDADILATTFALGSKFNTIPNGIELEAGNVSRGDLNSFLETNWSLSNIYPTSGNVLANDIDIDTIHSNLSVTEVNGQTMLSSGLIISDANGELVINSDGEYTYTPNVNGTPIVSFDYEISDGIGGTDSATLYIASYTTDSVIVGDNTDNILVGTDSSDSLFGEEGNDSIQGGDGNDTLDGGKGNDILDGGTGFDIVLGGEGNDTITYDSNDFIDGGVGEDTLLVSSTSLDLSNVKNIEVVELDNVSILDEIKVADVFNATDSSNELNIEGIGTVNIVTTDEGGDWVQSSSDPSVFSAVYGTETVIINIDDTHITIM